MSPYYGEEVRVAQPYFQRPYPAPRNAADSPSFPGCPGAIVCIYVGEQLVDNLAFDGAIAAGGMDEDAVRVGTGHHDKEGRPQAGLDTRVGDLVNAEVVPVELVIRPAMDQVKYRIASVALVVIGRQVDAVRFLFAGDLAEVGVGLGPAGQLGIWVRNGRPDNARPAGANRYRAGA